jgi:hypothetical protein
MHKRITYLKDDESVQRKKVKMNSHFQRNVASMGKSAVRPPLSEREKIGSRKKLQKQAKKY